MILFVDDEPRFAEAVVMELGHDGTPVELISDVDGALTFLSEHAAEVQLVLLDIMMPPGRLLSEVDTKRGRRSGMYLYEKLREIAPTTPFIILTNLSDSEVEQRFASEPNCRMLQKWRFLPYQVGEVAREMMVGAAQK